MTVEADAPPGVNGWRLYEHGLFLEQLEALVADAERAHLVPQRPQCADDIVFRLPLRVGQIHPLNRFRRDQIGMHQDQHAEFLHSATRWRPLCR